MAKKQSNRPTDRETFIFEMAKKPDFEDLQKHEAYGRVSRDTHLSSINFDDDDSKLLQEIARRSRNTRTPNRLIMLYNGVKETRVLLGQARNSAKHPGLGLTFPEAPERLLHLLLPAKYCESLIGCLQEDCRLTIYPKYGRRFAKLWYWMHVVWTIFGALTSRLRKLIGIGKLMEWF